MQEYMQYVVSNIYIHRESETETETERVQYVHSLIVRNIHIYRR